MASVRRYKLRRGFWLLFAVIMLWKSIPPAIYFIVREVHNLPTMFMSILGVFIIILLVDGRALKKIETRELQLLEIALPMLLIAAVVFLDLEDSITMTPVASTGYLFWRIHSIGTVVIFLTLIWQLVASILAGRSEVLPRE